MPTTAVPVTVIDDTYAPVTIPAGTLSGSLSVKVLRQMTNPAVWVGGVLPVVPVLPSAEDQMVSDAIGAGGLTDAELAATYESFLSPSGGDDGAQINAALNAGGGTVPTTVTLRGGTFTVGGGVLQANGAFLSQPSNTTLILKGATLRLGNAAGSPALMNAHPTPTGTPVDVNLAIVGVGNATIDGNAVNNPHIAGNLTQWKSNTVMYVGVTGFDIADITILNPSAWGFSPQNCTDWTFKRVASSCDSSTTNQSPIQAYGTNTRFAIDGITGNSQDDGVALLTYTKQQTGAFVYPTSGSVYPGGNITAWSVNNLVGIFGNSAGGAFRMICGDGSKIQHGTVKHIRNFSSNPWYAIQFGPNSYVTTPAASTDLEDITIDDIAASAWSVFLSIGQSCSDIRATNLTPQGSSNAVPTLVGNGDGSTITVSNFSVDGVHYHCPCPTGRLVKFPAGSTVSNLSVRNVEIPQLLRVLENGGAVTGLALSGIHIGELRQRMSLSTVAETGTMDSVQVDTFSGVANYSCTMWAGAPAQKLRLTNVPGFTTGDVAPLPTLGSQVNSDATLVLDGGAATAALYAGGPTTWARLVNTA
jgi:hypothetical protein